MPYHFRKLTSWLGVFAIWLMVVMPFASQMRLQQAVDFDEAMCSAGHSGQGSIQSARVSHAAQLDACGYCNFFLHTPALSSGAPCTFDAVLLPIVRIGTLVFSQWQRLRYEHAYPRAPPHII